MRKRFQFACWNCKRHYEITLEGQPTLSVACPFCGAEGIADLNPSPITEVLRSDPPAQESDMTDWEFPDVIPTRQKDGSDTGRVE